MEIHMEVLQDDAGDWHREQNYYSSSEVYTRSKRMMEAYFHVSESIFVL